MKADKQPTSISEGTFREAATFRRGFTRGDLLNREHGVPNVPLFDENSAAGIKYKVGPDGKTQVFFPDPAAHRRLVESLTLRLAEVENNKKSGPK